MALTIPPPGPFLPTLERSSCSAQKRTCNFVEPADCKFLRVLVKYLQNFRIRIHGGASMITMTEIARLTGVSQPTVSRVLNGNPNVGQEIRERVLACAKEHNYQCNALAKGLQGSKTMLLGVLVTDISNGFFADLAKAIEAAARKAGYTIILFNSDCDLEKERSYLDVVSRYRVDGVLVVPVKENGEELPDFAANLDIPVVAITKPAAALDAVYVDHRSAGALVAEHLAERGYRRFLFIGEEYDRKYLGFREKLAERGLAERTGSVAYESDRQLTHFLETWLRRPGGRTAVFAGNDIFALRTLSALRMLEVSVPRQAGVIGFDDTSTGRYLRPALSSVSQPIAAMAGEAVSRLLWRIDHPRAEEILDLALPAELVVRESA